MLLFPKIKKGTSWYCRVCFKELGGRNENFCSPACKEHYAICCWQGSARLAVARRDKGICSQCGLDSEGLKRKVSDRAIKVHDKKKIDPRVYIYRFERMFKFNTGHGAYWEADHIIPVKKGGAKLGLSNLQTLCIRCHKLKTFS